MRVAVVGSIDFTWHCLDELFKRDAEVVGVFSIHEQFRTSISDWRDLTDLTGAHKIPYFFFRKISDPDTVAQIRELKPDVVFLLGLSQIVSKEILEIPPIGVIGSHPALLPYHRGRAAIPWSILKGLDRSGLTLFYLDEGLDSGDILAQKVWTISVEDTATTLYGKMIEAGRELIRDTLPRLADGTAPRTPQDHSLASYWPRRTPADGLVDWKLAAGQLYDLVRASTHPYPGAYTFLEGEKIVIWSAALDGSHPSGAVPGEVVTISSNGVVVATGESTLLITSMQSERDGEQAASELAWQRGLSPGDQFDSRSPGVVYQS